MRQSTKKKMKARSTISRRDLKPLTPASRRPIKKKATSIKTPKAVFSSTRPVATAKKKKMMMMAPTTIMKKKTNTRSSSNNRKEDMPSVPKRKIFSSSSNKTKKSSVSRVTSKKSAGELYLKRKGLSVDDILKRSSTKSSTTKYVSNKRSIRNQAVKPMRVNRIPGKKQRLKAWCQERTRGYDIKINNMSRSWKNGKAFCALVYSACPKISQLSKEKTKSMKAAQRLKLAFDIAELQLGVEPVLEPEDITDLPRPDEKCIILYVSMIYRAITSRGL